MEEQMMTSTTVFPLPRSAPPASPLKWKRSREMELPTRQHAQCLRTKKGRFKYLDFPKKKIHQTSVLLFDDYICLHAAMGKSEMKGLREAEQAL